MATHSDTRLANGHHLIVADDPGGKPGRCQVIERDNTGAFVRFRYSGSLADCRTYVRERAKQTRRAKIVTARDRRARIDRR